MYCFWMVGISSQNKKNKPKESKKCLSYESELIIWDLPKSKGMEKGILLFT